jgi:hypothetical protein
MSAATLKRAFPTQLRQTGHCGGKVPWIPMKATTLQKCRQLIFEAIR